jgi:hypothetical protein
MSEMISLGKFSNVDIKERNKNGCNSDIQLPHVSFIKEELRK